MIDSPALKALAARLVREEVERRKPKDVDAVMNVVGDRFTVTDAGDIVAVSETGARLVGKSADYNMGIGEYLDILAKEQPDIFGPAEKVSNPFRKGPDFNLSRQMVLMRTDPEMADKLAAEAGAYVPKSF